VPQLDVLDKEEFSAEEKEDALAAYEERRDEFDLEVEDVPADQVRYALLRCSTWWSKKVSHYQMIKKSY